MSKIIFLSFIAAIMIIAAILISSYISAIVIFQDNFTTSGGFINSTPNRARWEFGNVTQTGAGGCYSGSGCWKTNLTGNYLEANLNASIILNVPVNLSLYLTANISFWHYRKFEDINAQYDCGVLDINATNVTKSGIWTRISPIGGYTGKCVGTSGLLNQLSYGLQGDGWEFAVFNITNYTNNDFIKTRFFFQTDTYGVDRGWSVDNFKIEGEPLPCTYVSGMGNWDIDCNCNLTRNTNLLGNNITINGTGTMLITGNITNWKKLNIFGKNVTNKCIIRCTKGGCFR